jgi:ATP-dependent exoDNAse (exonuclease V) beta subunit
VDSDAAERIRRRVLQENQRLLYVAMTRAKRRLVLVDDLSLFGDGKKGSFADCLGLRRDPPPTFWAALPTADASCADPAAATRPSAPAPELPALDLHAIEAARLHAGRFPHRVLPHALAEHASDDEPESRLDADEDARDASGAETARRYGLWWHDLMERLDWKAPDGWHAAYAARLTTCPLPQRAEREWGLFVGSNVASLLSPAELVVHVEAPFLRSLAPDRCVEGIVDLAAYDPRDNSWLLLDWKTNVITGEGVGALAALYAPQLAQYADAIRASCRPAALRAYLYSTAAGRLVPLDV